MTDITDEYVHATASQLVLLAVVAAAFRTVVSAVAVVHVAFRVWEYCDGGKEHAPAC